MFIEQGHKLASTNGVLSYIIPKSFSFSSNYATVRDFIENDFQILIDCGKAFEQVKLEACIIVLAKQSNSKSYSSLLFLDKEFVEVNHIAKNYKSKFGFFLNGINQSELEIGNKILSNTIFLKKIINNSRGEILQKFISNEGDVEIIGGKEIDKFGIRGIKGKIDNKYINTAKCHINNNSILVQRIVAHITKPYPQIKITACIPNCKDNIITDTINQLTITDINYLQQYLWALLNSKLICWYSYNFIFGRAIRTMQFDNPVTDRIPIKALTLIEQQPIIKLGDKILELKKQDPKANTAELEKEIDKMVYTHYNLTDDEIATIEKI